jgi:hypothetical protein
MKDKAELHIQTVFILDKITYLPHYRNNNVFVGPGYPKHNKFRYSAHDLLQAGALKSLYPLWSRGITDLVSDSRP